MRQGRGVRPRVRSPLRRIRRQQQQRAREDRQRRGPEREQEESFDKLIRHHVLQDHVRGN